MSEKDFIQLLQNLLTMVNPNDPASVARVKNILEELFDLTTQTRSCGPDTIQMVGMANDLIDQLIRFRDDFAGKAGDNAGNAARRRRLAMMLQPGC